MSKQGKPILTQRTLVLIQYFCNWEIDNIDTILMLY